MLLMIDNYDSFTYNLVQYFGELGHPMTIHRNDQLTIQDIRTLNPKGIVISPGPGNPDQAGISLELIQTFYTTIPIFGVCLGHQSIYQAFGGQIIRAPRLMHGKTSEIIHDGSQLFLGIPNPFIATRYHSLIADTQNIPNDLMITAWTAEKEAMALCHRLYPVYGVQFHPESILTSQGKQLLKNWLNLIKES